MTLFRWALQKVSWRLFEVTHGQKFWSRVKFTEFSSILKRVLACKTKLKVSAKKVSFAQEARLRRNQICHNLLRDRVPVIPQSRSRKSGIGTHHKIRDWNRDSNSKIRDPGLGPGPRFVGRGIPGLNSSGLSWGPKKSGTRSRSHADPCSGT